MAPTPTMAPVMVWVVETGMPQWASARMVTPPPVSAQKPPMGCSLVRPVPMVFTMRHPPKKVPRPMAAWQASTTQNGMWNSCPLRTVPNRIRAMMPITFCASLVPWL